MHLEQQTSVPALFAEPKHIVHIVRQFWPSVGGLEDFVEKLTACQVARGHRVTIVTCDTIFATGEKLCAVQDWNHRQIIRIPFYGSQRYPIAPSALKHIADADFVHVHAIDFFFDFMALTRIFHKKPLVATIHGGFFHTKRFLTIKKLWFQTLTRFSTSQYKLVIGCSGNDKRLFQRIGGQQIIAVDNGVDVKKFQNKSSQKPTKRLVTIGRFSKNKRLDNLIAAMKNLVADDKNWFLDIIGTPSDWSVAEIKQMIIKNELADYIQLHIQPEKEAICEIIERTSLFVSASEYEGFGLAVVEAMSAGLVPILQNNSTFQDLYTRHQGLAICDFDNSKHAANAITAHYKVLENSKGAMRQQMIDQAQIYSWDKVSASYEAAYVAALSDKLV